MTALEDAYKTLKVLVIDDQETFRTTIGAMLEHLGVAGVLEAEDGAAGFDEVIHSRPDIVLCDMQMTPTDGQALVWSAAGAKWLPGTVSGGGGGTLAARAAVAATTASLANTATGNLTITGYKGYMLYKIQTSAAAWVRIYTDTTSRTADATRLEGADPTPGSGVVAEVITTGAQTILISPGALGFSNETVPDTNIQLAVTNKSGGTTTITVTLTAVQLEA